MECTSPFLYLADTIRDDDERQDAIVLILEQQPATKAEAQVIIARLGHTKRNDARKRPLQLSHEPSSDGLECTGVHEAISRLPAAERELVTLRYIHGLTISAISIRLNREYKATHTDLTRAVEKLRLMLTKIP